jgi:hypothetical protein
MDVSKVLEELKAERSKIEAWIRRRESDEPPSAGASCGVRVPGPKPKLPPAAVALPLPAPEEDPLAAFSASAAHH